MRKVVRLAGAVEHGDSLPVRGGDPDGFADGDDEERVGVDERSRDRAMSSRLTPSMRAARRSR